MPLNLNDADKIKELIVQPMVDAVRAEMRTATDAMRDQIQPLVALKQNHEDRLGKLENNQKRAMVGWGVFASGMALAATASWEWVKSKVKIG